MIELIEDAIGRDARRPDGPRRDPCRSRPSTGCRSRTSWGQGKLILEIYEKTTEADLWGPIFVTDYPQEVSPLARTIARSPV